MDRVKRGWWTQSPECEAMDQVMLDGTGKATIEKLTVNQELMLRATTAKLEISREFAVASSEVAIDRIDVLVCTAVDYPAFVEHLAAHLVDLDDKINSEGSDIESADAVRLRSQENICHYLLGFAGLTSSQLVAMAVQFLLDGVHADGVTREEKAMKSFSKYIKSLHSKESVRHEEDEVSDDEGDEGENGI